MVSRRWRSTSNRSTRTDRKSTRLNSSHGYISYAVFCLKKKNLQANAGDPRLVKAGDNGLDVRFGILTARKHRGVAENRTRRAALGLNARLPTDAQVTSR